MAPAKGKFAQSYPARPSRHPPRSPPYRRPTGRNGVLSSENHFRARKAIMPGESAPPNLDDEIDRYGHEREQADEPDKPEESRGGGGRNASYRYQGQTS